MSLSYFSVCCLWGCLHLFILIFVWLFAFPNIKRMRRFMLCLSAEIFSDIIHSDSDTHFFGRIKSAYVRTESRCRNAATAHLFGDSAAITHTHTRSWSETKKQFRASCPSQCRRRSNGIYSNVPRMETELSGEILCAAVAVRSALVNTTRPIAVWTAKPKATEMKILRTKTHLF